MTHQELDPLTHPSLPRIRQPPGPWRCRVCHYGPIDNGIKNCVSCGRDWVGRPGTIPDDVPFRPGLKDPPDA